MLNEDDLLVAAQQNNPDALMAIYDRYQAMIYAYAYRMVLNADAAEDCTAATFERLLAALQKGAGPKQHLKAYLFRIAHNWMVDWVRRESRQISTDFTDQAWPADDPSPDEAAAKRMNTARMMKHLQQLTPQQREVLILRFMDGFSLHETAKLLHKPVGAIKSLQKRALTRLRHEMESVDEMSDDHEKEG